MGLQQETKKVVSQFEFSDADINSHVAEFLKQMSPSRPLRIRAPTVRNR